MHFIKFIRRPEIHQTIEELKRYSQIRRHLSEPGNENLLISRLAGLIIGPASRALIGMLLTYIDCECSTLYCAAGNLESSPELCTRWADQVRSTLARLRRVEIIWATRSREHYEQRPRPHLSTDPLGL
jgi:hypothetical protein